MNLKKSLLPLLFASACASMWAVTLNVTTPEGTKACFVAGKFNNWNAAGATQLNNDGNGHFSIELPDVSDQTMAEGYKYLSGPDWKFVEKNATGGEISNRTKVSDNDRVESWAALYDTSVISKTIRLNGHDRKLRIYLPEGYDSSQASYPVIYMTGVQQRYSAAGSDDPGDDFFGPDSWNASATMEQMRLQGAPASIIVGLYSFVAENIPDAHPDFAGSGQADAFLGEFIDNVIPLVNSSYRTLTGPGNTAIVGADLGALFSLHAALERPDVFGKCVAMSPMLWLNRNRILDRARLAAPDTRFILSYGTRETDIIRNDVDDLASALGVTPIQFQGGWHDDSSWGEAFPTVYSAITAAENTATPASVLLPRASMRRASIPKAADIANSTYTFYYREADTDVSPDPSVSFSLTDSYIQTNGVAVTAQVTIKDIPASVKDTKVYWNVARTSGETHEFIQEKVGNVSFSAKKKNDSWLRIVIRGEESVTSHAASSQGFRLVTADSKIAMTPQAGHKASATASFPTADKSFKIHFGSVNTESDMGAITGSLTVSDNCTEANILYDFNTNAVTVTETNWGETIEDLVFEEFSASPSVTDAGADSHITIRLAEGSGCSIALRITHDYASPEDVTLTPLDDRTWTATIRNLNPGLYTLTADAIKGSSSKENVAGISIRVLPEPYAEKQQRLTVNAYEGLDWTSTGRYKANFHTHTSQSFDTQYNTTHVVDAYAKAGYKILALTDHDSNPYPWTLFDLFNPDAQSRDPEALGMLAIPGVELSKDNTNSWSEASGGDFNHHNDFFTGRKGQEFTSLRESYDYTCKLGGMQIINHPGQYWNLDNTYTPGEKNSPEWHAQNFSMFPSLIGLEVYNQGNRRPNDRILWDQILDITMPARPVWGYSCDDTHTAEQYFRNYQFMLMPELTVDALKDAMRNGTQYFSYEYTGSGEAKAPRINRIDVDNEACTVSIDTDADEIYWIYSTDKPEGAAPGKRKSTVIAMGPVFNFTGYQGKYVRALIKNKFGETCTQPFGFSEDVITAAPAPEPYDNLTVSVFPNPASETVNVKASDNISAIELIAMTGATVLRTNPHGTDAAIDVDSLPRGAYLLRVSTGETSSIHKLILK